MKRRSRAKNCGKRSRSRKGGALEGANYPGSVTSTGGHWSSQVAGNPVVAAANGYQSFLSKFATESGGAGENPTLAREMLSSYALRGGQSGGGSKRHRRHHKRSKRMRMSRSQAQGQAQALSQGLAQGQSGGMFATFGALLKEALVPLGLLAAQQAYGKKYDNKNKTRKSRK